MRMTSLSNDLVPIYDLELKLGNKVLRTDSPAGTICPLAIIFRDPLHFEEIKSLKLPASVTKWTNDDPHYPLETGFSSSVSKHAIAGPTPAGKPSKS